MDKKEIFDNLKELSKTICIECYADYSACSKCMKHRLINEIVKRL